MGAHPGDAGLVALPSPREALSHHQHSLASDDVTTPGAAVGRDLLVSGKAHPWTPFMGALRRWRRRSSIEERCNRHPEDAEPKGAVETPTPWQALWRTYVRSGVADV